MLKLKFKKLVSSAVIPSIANVSDAGFDLYSTEEVVLEKGRVNTIALGIISEIPEGYYVSIRDRSGLAAKQGIHTLAGVIDSGYRGEWKVVLINLGHGDYKVNKGDRIAQGILTKLNQFEIVETDVLTKTERDTGGFGSSGK